MTVDLSIAVVNWNARDHLHRCVRSIYDQTRSICFEILIVDNGSTDGSAQMVDREFPEAWLIQNQANRGFSRATNQALQVSRGRYVLLLNPDTLILDGALDKMIQYADGHPEIGALGCRLLTSDESIDLRCARRWPTLWSELCDKTGLATRFPASRIFGWYQLGYWDHAHSREVEALSGACLMVRREALEQVGLLDERFYMYGEDIDWCYRIQQVGWKVLYFAGAEVIHVGGGSSSTVKEELDMVALDSRWLFFRKHYGAPYALAFKAMMLAVTLTKQLFFLIKWSLSTNADTGALLRRKLQLHSRVLEWVFTGVWQTCESGGGIRNA